MKNLRKICCIICIVFMLNSICFADLVGDSYEDLQDEVLEVVNNIETEKEPKIQAPSAICFDRVSKKVIYEKNAYEKRPMASTTKIMTAIVAIENGNLEDTVIVSKKAASIGGSRLGLKTGDKVLLRDLLYGLLLCSRK